jgi:hypothetical protein
LRDHYRPFLLPVSYLDELLVRFFLVVGCAAVGSVIVAFTCMVRAISDDFGSTLIAVIAYGLGLAVAGLVGLAATLPKRGMRTLDRSRALLRLLRFGFVHRAHLSNVRFASEPLLPDRRDPVAAFHALCFECDVDERHSGNY